MEVFIEEDTVGIDGTTETTETIESSNEIINLLKSFNKLDNNIVKYIYKKYINNINEIYNEDKYKIYKNTIFSLERPAIITQKESLETDLQNMEIADEAYDVDPVNFKSTQFDSLPDIKRCSFIRKHKNKYKRCENGILNVDSDMCYKHIDSINMYWDRYCEILEEIEKLEK